MYLLVRIYVFLICIPCVYFKYNKYIHIEIHHIKKSIKKLHKLFRLLFMFSQYNSSGMVIPTKIDLGSLPSTFFFKKTFGSKKLAEKLKFVIRTVEFSWLEVEVYDGTECMCHVATCRAGQTLVHGPKFFFIFPIFWVI